jgi:hypothetical protein
MKGRIREKDKKERMEKRNDGRKRRSTRAELKKEASSRCSGSEDARV